MTVVLFQKKAGCVGQGSGVQLQPGPVDGGTTP